MTSHHLIVNGCANGNNGGNGAQQPQQSSWSATNGDSCGEPTLIPKRVRSAVSMRADETDNWGNEAIDEREEFTLTLKDPTMTDTLVTRLDMFRRNRELCDVVLFVKEREILAHKVVLAAMSPALFDMFMSGNDQQQPSDATTDPSSPPPTPLATVAAVGNNGRSGGGQGYYEFSQTDFECFEALVNFAYTSQLEIRSRKIAELYKTAYSLRITNCVKACARYLAQNIAVSNAIGIRKSANFNNDLFLMGKVDDFIVQNFAKIVDESLEFTQLPCVKARIIVSGSEDARKMRLGLNLAEKALAYFQNLHPATDKVEQFIDQLLEKTHVLYEDEDACLQDGAEMDEHSTVGASDIIRDYKRGGGHRSSSITAPLGVPTVQHHVTGAVPVKINARFMPDVRYASTESLSSMASSASEIDEEILYKLIAIHQTADEFWVALAVVRRRLVAISLQMTDDAEVARKPSKKEKSPQLIGDEQQWAAKAENGGLSGLSIPSMMDEREPLATMTDARCSVGAALLGENVIVCGGYDRGECLKSVEEYDVIDGCWRILPSMDSERGRFDAAVVSGRLYAVAGSNGNNDLNTAECYDPDRQKWSAIASLSQPRSHNGCATLDGSLYCIGGSNEGHVLKECERYSPHTNKWESIPSMHTGRFQAGCTAWRGMIVACGGCDRWNCLDSVEAYDPALNSWRELAKLHTPRRGCAVAVVGDSLYVIGGNDGTQSLSTVEILDSPAGKWRAGPPLTTPRANTHAVTTKNNVIYIVGGFNGNHFLSSIELLEDESTGWRNWQQTPSGSPVPPIEAEQATNINGSTTPNAETTVHRSVVQAK